jgi:hypothetical protein
VANKVRASIWRLDVSSYPAVVIGGAQVLSGLGPSPSSETSSGKAITNVPIDGYYIVAGTAADLSKTNAVRWRISPRMPNDDRVIIKNRSGARVMSPQPTGDSAHDPYHRRDGTRAPGPHRMFGPDSE